MSADTGNFWFFNAANVELVVRSWTRGRSTGVLGVLRALSDVQYTITVTDTATGAVKTYNNPGQPGQRGRHRGFLAGRRRPAGTAASPGKAEETARRGGDGGRPPIRRDVAQPDAVLPGGNGDREKRPFAWATGSESPDSVAADQPPSCTRLATRARSRPVGFATANEAPLVHSR